MKTIVLRPFWRMVYAVILTVVCIGVGGALFGPARAQDEGSEVIEELFKSRTVAKPKKAKQKARTKRVSRKVKRKRKRKIRKARRKMPVKQNIAPALIIKRLDPAWWLQPLQSRYVPGEILLTLPSEAPPGTVQQISRDHGLRLLSVDQNRLLEEPVYFFDYADSRSVPEVIAALRTANGSVIVQPNYIYAEQAAPGAGARARNNYAIQYALEKLRIGDAHERMTGQGVTVAVLDSAIDLKHPELAGTVTSAFDAIARGGARGGQPHGTAIASIIAAHGQLTGIAPDAKLASVRAFSKSSSTGPALSTTRALLKGLDWAHLQNTRIYNLSFAGPKDPLFLRALERLSKTGAILVAAAGNEGANSPRLFPAAAANVIAVTAIDSKDALFNAASQGDYVELAGPGVDILVAAPGGGFGFLSGTSMAAAHISALAALILERKPDISARTLRKILQSTADDLGVKGRDTRFGAGRANAPAAIMAAGG